MKKKKGEGTEMEGEREYREVTLEIRDIIIIKGKQGETIENRQEMVPEIKEKQ